MDRCQKIDCKANSGVIFRATRPLHLKGPKNLFTGSSAKPNGSRSPISTNNGIDSHKIRQSLQSYAYLKLQDLIIANELVPGRMYSEAILSKTFGISRSPIREALQHLERDGLVVTLPQRGFYLCEFVGKDIDEFFGLRKALEGFALEFAVKINSGIDFHEMTENLNSQRKAVKKRNFAEFIRKDRQFHEALVRSTGNERLTSVFLSLRSWIEIVAFRVLQESGTADQYREIIGDHKRILLALKKRDPMLGRQALLTHFDRAAETMKMAITGNSREKSLHLQKALDGS